MPPPHNQSLSITNLNHPDHPDTRVRVHASSAMIAPRLLLLFQQQQALTNPLASSDIIPTPPSNTERRHGTPRHHGSECVMGRQRGAATVGGAGVHPLAKGSSSSSSSPPRLAAVLLLLVALIMAQQPTVVEAGPFGKKAAPAPAAPPAASKSGCVRRRRDVGVCVFDTAGGISAAWIFRRITRQRRPNGNGTVSCHRPLMPTYVQQGQRRRVDHR
jgi:hypothetical protein